MAAKAKPKKTAKRPAKTGRSRISEPQKRKSKRAPSKPAARKPIVRLRADKRTPSKRSGPARKATPSRAGRTTPKRTKAKVQKRVSHDTRRQSVSNRRRDSKDTARAKASRTANKAHSKRRGKGAGASRSKGKRNARGDSGRVGKLERQIASQREIIRELTRSPTARAQGSRRVEMDDNDDDSGYEIPKGEQNEFGGMVEYIGDEFGSIDWTDFDYDDAYDDVGDEDEDSYGEDAT